MIPYQVAVVGAGLAGAVAARLFADAGAQALVLERQDHIGGNVYDCMDPHGILIHRYGPHIFHTKDEDVYRFLARFSSWRPYEHRVLAHVHGLLTPVPFNLRSLELAFGDKAPRLEAKLLAAYGAEQKIPILEFRKSDDPDIRAVADYVYQHIFLRYTMKQWGLSPERIDPAVTGRIPVFLSRDDRYFQDPFQGMPQKGYTPLFEALLASDRITLRLGTPAADLLSLEEDRILLEGQPFSGPLIYTGSIDELFEFSLGALPYRTLEFQFEHLPEDQYQPCGTVNYTTTEEFTRITEFKHLTGQIVPGHTSIVKEYSRPYQRAAGEIPYYPIVSPESQDLYAAYFKLAARYPSLHLVGRLAEYRYIDMDVTVSRSMALFLRIQSTRTSSRV